MMRGRGGCYKHTFYGIESHRCMETTPSLACANKCVFCWRLGLLTIYLCRMFHSPNLIIIIVYAYSALYNVTAVTAQLYNVNYFS